MRGTARRTLRAGVCTAVVAILVTTGLAGVSGASVGTSVRHEDGVTDKTIKIGFVYTATGVAASISKTGLIGFQARIDRENAKGGVNGRKIEVVSRDDQSSGANLTVTKDLIDNEKVFAVVNESPFAFLSYRFNLENGVPFIGAGTDGTYYLQPGNEDLMSSSGNAQPFGDTIYDTPARAMKMLGATKASALAYGQASASVSTAKAFMNYAVPEQGLKPVYTNTSVDFGSQDVGPLVLGIKNSGANATYLPMAAATNIAVAQGLQQNGVPMKATLLATGYGQDFLDSPAAKTADSSWVFTLGYKPVELKDKATKRFQSDLKKYQQFTGVPDFGIYAGYILGEYTILALQKAGKTLTRQGLIDAAKTLTTYDQAGLACQPVDINPADRNKTPATGCGYFAQVKNGKFVLFPKNGKPIKGKLVGSPEGLAAAGVTSSGVPTTTAAGG
jgi:ABC-type branched-subunit amino acid transport system substrate-binding protein